MDAVAARCATVIGLLALLKLALSGKPDQFLKVLAIVDVPAIAIDTLLKCTLPRKCDYRRNELAFAMIPMPGLIGLFRFDTFKIQFYFYAWMSCYILKNGVCGVLVGVVGCFQEFFGLSPNSYLPKPELCKTDH